MPWPGRAPDRERFERLVEAIPDAVLFIDGGARIVHLNPAAERTFGYTRDELLGQRVNVLMPRPYADEHDSYIRRYEETGEARVIGTTRVLDARRKSGEVFPIELSIMSLVGDEGEHGARYGAFLRDISEREQLRRDLLEKSRLAAVGTVAAALVHELGNPLNNMHLNVQLLARRFEVLGAEDTQARERLTLLVEEVRRLADLLDEFRLLSRRQTLKVADLDVSELIRRVCGEHRALFEAGNIGIEHHIEPDLPPLKADPDKLRQVLLNVCKNAVEAMPGGGTLRLAANRTGEHVLIEVADTGVGVPVGSDVFEPFLTTKDTGTGLGLAIVKRVVDAHGGEVSFEGRREGGTIFRIRLPVGGPAGVTLSLA